MKYLMYTLDAYVNMDYSLVYFHHGLSSKNKPPMRWMWEVYKALGIVSNKMSIVTIFGHKHFT